MARRSTTIGTRRYLVAIDADLPVALRTWAVVKAQIRDELTGAAPEAPVTLHCDNPNLIARVGPEGEAGVAAVPAQALPLLRTNGYPIRLSVRGDGYIADALEVTIPNQPAFPGSFVPFDIGPWELHREPLSIYGRVELRQLLVPDRPVTGATISINRLWMRCPTPALPGPDAMTPLALSPRCAARRPALSTVVARAMTPSGGPYQLVQDLTPGASQVLLSNTVGLAAGDVLAFDRADLDRVEYLAVAAIPGAAPATAPALVDLRFPCQHLHLALVGVDRVTPQPPGAVNLTAVPAIAGDQTLLLQSPMAGIIANDVVEISGGTAGAEYLIANPAVTITNALGFYRLPPLARVCQLELQADDGVHAAVLQTMLPEYGGPEQRVDFLLH